MVTVGANVVLFLSVSGPRCSSRVLSRIPSVFSGKPSNLARRGGHTCGITFTFSSVELLVPHGRKRGSHLSTPTSDRSPANFSIAYTMNPCGRRSYLRVEIGKCNVTLRLDMRYNLSGTNGRLFSTLGFTEDTFLAHSIEYTAGFGKSVKFLESIRTQQFIYRYMLFVASYLQGKATFIVAP